MKKLDWWVWCLRCTHDKERINHCNMCTRNPFAPSSDKKSDHFEDWCPNRAEKDAAIA